MKKEIFTLTLSAVLIALSSPVEAQQPKKVAKIGFLSTSSSPSEPFRHGLRDLGWVEGQNISIEYRLVAGKVASLPAMAEELVGLKVDVIVTQGEPALRAARQATSTIPIVMTSSGDPVGTGFVASLARPGGNITGPAILAPEISGKRLELLKEVFPRMARVAAFWDPHGGRAPVTGTEDAARVLALQLQILEIPRPDDFDTAFELARKGRAEALTVLPSVFLSDHRSRLIAFAATSRLPAVYPWRSAVNAGGLMFYGPVLSESYRRAAVYVDKILKGAKPSDLPVEQPTKFEFVINLKTAKQIGLTIPPNVLARADRVIK
jgi:putative tryptophan/tyrosine transport system substrate-binding protein